MKIFVGITDGGWCDFLRDGSYTEVNFWKPSGKPFKAISKGELFLFKLKASRGHMIVGGGFFEEYRLMSVDWAWRAFECENGAHNLAELCERIGKYRVNSTLNIVDSQIGCIMLSDVFWLDEKDWFLAPGNWNAIVTGKTFDTDDQGSSDDCKWLYDQIKARLSGKELFSEQSPEDLILPISSGYTIGTAKHRIGQGVFSVRVADAYHHRCAITGERTMPVLQAAHIKPVSNNGPYSVPNGMLLRSDIHTLFDWGYITVNDDLRVEVSGRLHDDWKNGKEYYAFHGKKLAVIPDLVALRPALEYLDWHHEHVFRG